MEYMCNIFKHDVQYYRDSGEKLIYGCQIFYPKIEKRLVHGLNLIYRELWFCPLKICK